MRTALVAGAGRRTADGDLPVSLGIVAPGSLGLWSCPVPDRSRSGGRTDPTTIERSHQVGLIGTSPLVALALPGRPSTSHRGTTNNRATSPVGIR